MSSVIFGIDLGTTNSSIAFITNKGEAEVVIDNDGERTTPSCVLYETSGNKIVGKHAFSRIKNCPQNYIYEIKMLLGKRYEEVATLVKKLKYKVVNDKGLPKIVIKLATGEKYLSPEEVSAEILKHIKQFTEAKDHKVDHVVITVPANFTSSQRKATKEAAQLAGMKVLKLLNEPTAAALAYVQRHDLKQTDNKKRNILVYDLGGGTFDVTIMEIYNRKITIKSTAGDLDLGGKNFDMKLLEHYKSKTRKEISPKREHLIYKSCVDAKELLSFCEETHIGMDSAEGSITIARAEFEAMIKPELDKSIKIVKNCMKDAKMACSHIDHVVLVGGSSRIPKIKEMLAEMFDDEKITEAIDPDKAVGNGAAIQASLLNQYPEPLLDNYAVTDITPLSIGVECKGGLMSVLITRNTSIPATGSKTFTITDDNQRLMKIKVFQGERAQTKDNYLLGEVTIADVTREKLPIKVEMQIDTDGILKVFALTADGNKEELQILYKPKIDNLDDIIQEANDFKNEDDNFKETVKSKYTLEMYCQKVMTDIAENKNMKQLIKNSINRKCRECLRWLKSEDISKCDVDVKMEELKKLVKIYSESCD